MKLTNKFAIISLVLSALGFIGKSLGYMTFEYLPEIFLVISETIATVEIVIIIRQIRSELKQDPEATLIDRWTTAVVHTFGSNKFFVFATNEFLIFYYFFYGLLNRPKISRNEFSYTNAGILKYFILTITLVSFAEIPAFHILFGLWNEKVAWLVTFLSIYGLIWVIGDFQLMRFHPIRVENDRVQIRIGFRWKLDIDYSMIQSIELRSPENKKEYLKLTPESKIGIIIQLREKVTVLGLFGAKRVSDKIALQVDDNQWLVTQVRSKMVDLWHETTDMSVRTPAT